MDGGTIGGAGNGDGVTAVVLDGRRSHLCDGQRGHSRGVVARLGGYCLNGGGGSDVEGSTVCCAGCGGGAATGGVVDGTAAGDGDHLGGTIETDYRWCTILQCYCATTNLGIDHVFFNSDGLDGDTAYILRQRSSVLGTRSGRSATVSGVVDGGTLSGTGDGYGVTAVVLDGRRSHFGDGQLGHFRGEVARIGGDGLDGSP